MCMGPCQVVLGQISIDQKSSAVNDFIQHYFHLYITFICIKFIYYLIAVRTNFKPLLPIHCGGVLSACQFIDIGLSPKETKMKF